MFLESLFLLYGKLCIFCIDGITNRMKRTIEKKGKYLYTINITRN